MSLECGDCERDLRGGVHDQDCRYAVHLLEDGQPRGCDFETFPEMFKGIKDTDNREQVSCIACLTNAGLTPRTGEA